MKNAYGPSIILFTILIRILIFPLSYQQIASTQMTQALNPKVQEIKEKYADNKDLQNQMTALLYQETKVTYSTFSRSHILSISHTHSLTLSLTHSLTLSLALSFTTSLSLSNRSILSLAVYPRSFSFLYLSLSTDPS